MSSILTFENVYKSFSAQAVLENISFHVNKSEVVALLGVNGAGKTTALKLMLGQELPTSGTVRLSEQNPKNYVARQYVGMTPQNIDFPEGIKTKEILTFVHQHYLRPHPVHYMVETFELGSFLEQRAAKLSGGQKRRLALALAFIGNPGLVFLDEPTTGLDVGARKILWEFIKQEANKGVTFVLTTHYLEEIEQIATRVLFLQNKQLKIDGTVDNIKKIASASFTKINFIGEKDWNFSSFSHCKQAYFQHGKWTIETAEPDNLIRELVANQISFQNLNVERDNLESAFLNLSTDK